MCDLATGLSVAGAAFSYMKQSSTANAQANAINAQVATSNEGTLASNTEKQQALTEEASKSALEERIATARLRNAGADSGTYGGTNDRVMEQARVTLAQDIGTIDANKARTTAQTQRELNAIATSGGAKLASVARPSLIGTALQVASAYDAYGQREDLKKLPKAKA